MWVCLSNRPWVKLALPLRLYIYRQLTRNNWWIYALISCCISLILYWKKRARICLSVCAGDFTREAREPYLPTDRPWCWPGSQRSVHHRHRYRRRVRQPLSGPGGCWILPGQQLCVPLRDSPSLFFGYSSLSHLFFISDIHHVDWWKKLSGLWKSPLLWEQTVTIF